MRHLDYDSLAEVGGSDWHILYRGRYSDQTAVLAKTPRGSTRRAFQTELLRREFELLEGLIARGVPRATDFLSNDKGCWLILQDPGGLPLSQLVSSFTSDLGRALDLAFQLCSCLAEIHSYDIFLRCIHPMGILIQPASLSACFVDFSLAVKGSDTVPASLPLRRDLLAYCSPEQTGRMNREVDYRADFYSLGVVL